MTATAIQDAAAPAASRPAPARRLRVLVLDEGLPWPPNSGKRLRSWHLLRRLAGRHRVELMAFAAPGAEASAAVEALHAAGIVCHTVTAPADKRGAALYADLLANCASRWPYSVAKHYRRRFQAALDALLAQEQFDLLQVEWTPYAAYCRAGGPPQVIATHNIEAQIWRRRAAAAGGGLARFYFGWQAEKMRRFEAAAFRRARAVTAVSADDLRIASAEGAARASIVANGVDLDDFRPQAAASVSGRMVFVGALDWYPNQDAAAFFARQVLPRIRAQRPEAHLRVVGRRPPAALRRELEGLPGVELVGEVADVRPAMAEAALVLAPLRIGGGSRIKILEALAMDKPVLATRIGAEGLETEAGRHLAIADRPEELAAAALELLASPRRAEAMGRAGGMWVRERHGWDECARALEAAWRAAAGGAA
jgi:sugar transferase (PEP-CTERM/EpsH1 system associated)